MNDDDLLGQWLSPAPVAAPIATSTGDDLLSSFLPPPDTYHAGGMQVSPEALRAQGLPVLSDADRAEIEARKNDNMSIPSRIDSIQSAKDAALATANYAKNQLLSVPGQIGNNFNAGLNLYKSGSTDPNYLPSFPSADPKTWEPGSLLREGGGALGMATSPLTGVTNKLVNEPVTEATGNPAIGDAVETVVSAKGIPRITGALGGAGADAETLRLANIAHNSGIPIRASQISTNPFVQKTDQVLGWLPGSGRQAETAAQNSAIVRAISNTVGEDTPSISRNVVGNAQDRIGGVLNTIENRTPVNFDNDLMNNLGQIEQSARDTFTANSPQYQQIRSQVDQLMRVGAQHNGQIPGDVWAQFYHKNSPLSNLASSSDSDVSRFASGLKHAAQDAVQRSATPEDATAYQNARFQYKNLKTIEPLVTKGSSDEISPLLLRGRVDANFPTRDGGPLGDIADIGQRFLRQPKDSGTPLGTKIINALGTPGQLALAGAGAFGANKLGYSLPEMLAAGVGVPAVNATVARMGSALLNNPIYRRSLLRGPDTNDLAKQLIYGAAPTVPMMIPQNPSQLKR